MTVTSPIRRLWRRAKGFGLSGRTALACARTSILVGLFVFILGLASYTQETGRKLGSEMHELH